MFDDRTDAGRQLGKALERYRERNPLVLAIPKGGLPVGVEVARHLKAEFNVLVSRKLPFPYSPESGFGAIAEDGTRYLHEMAAHPFSDADIDAIAREQSYEIARRIQLLRDGNALTPLRGRTVILVDDGIAMGSTMRASIAMCRNQDVAHVVAAAPVASPRTVEDIRRDADAVIILETPPGFRAVAQIYRNWYDVSDAEAVAILKGHEMA